MLFSAAFYLGLLAAAGGLLLRAPALSALGILSAVTALGLPAPERRSTPPNSHLDEFIPVWQFDEFHTLHIAAPPARVFDDIKRVRADEIFLFRTLFWIRMCGRPARTDAPARSAALIDVATRGTFVYLADDVIYPGSAIIRRMWLRAVKRRATAPLVTAAG